MILRDNGYIEIEGESDDESMPPLEDDDNDDVEYPIVGELLVARHVLNMQVKDENEV